MLSAIYLTNCLYNYFETVSVHIFSGLIHSLESLTRFVVSGFFHHSLTAEYTEPNNGESYLKL